MWESLTGLPNLFARFRVMWGRPAQAGNVVRPGADAGSVHGVQGAGLRELLNLILTFIGTVATVIGTMLAVSGH
ncbi:MAG: hypothetical protein ACRD0K_22435 [Egibacteraceae bacterium]